ncbi:MAG: hypothetical protein WCJ64_01985 [Rhodospirillaceae bacterium]
MIPRTLFAVLVSTFLVTPAYAEADNQIDMVRPSAQLLLKALNTALGSWLMSIPFDWAPYGQRREVKIAFSMSYSNTDIELHSVFFQTREIGSNCHACLANVGSIIFKRVDGHIYFIKHQLLLLKAGVWGNYNKFDRDLTISSKDGHVTMLVIGKDGQGGIDGSFADILIFSGRQWEYAGRIDVAGSDCGRYDDCYEYKGEPHLIQTDSDYPDILITMKGTMREQDHDRTSPLRPVSDCYYSFRGNGYHLTGGVGCGSDLKRVTVIGRAAPAKDPVSLLSEESPGPKVDAAIRRIYRFK